MGLIESIEYMTKKAEDEGDIGYMESLGLIYYEGKDGVEKDYDKAFKWFKMAYESCVKHKYRMNCYMPCTYYGYGCDIDHKKAAELYTKMDYSYHPATYRLACMYQKGIGVDKDIDKAITNFMSVIKYKGPEAYIAIGSLYEEKKDFIKAIYYYEEALNYSDSYFGHVSDSDITKAKTIAYEKLSKIDGYIHSSSSSSYKKIN